MRITSFFLTLLVLFVTSIQVLFAAPTLDEAKNLKQNRQFDKAIEAYKQLVENDSENVQLQLDLADCYLGNKNYSEALMVLYGAIAQDKTCLIAYVKLAQINAIQLNNKQDAIAILDKMTNANDKSAEAYAYKAQFLLQFGEKDKALLAAQKMIQLDNSAPSALRFLEILIKAGQVDEAQKVIAEFKKAPFPPFLINFFDGRILMEKKSWKDAIVKFESAIKEIDVKPELKPMVAQIYEYLGSCNEQLSQFDRQLDCFDKALELTPDSISGQLGRAMALNHLKRNTEALAEFNKIKNRVGDKVFLADPKLKGLYYKLELEQLNSLSPEQRKAKEEEIAKQNADDDNYSDTLAVMTKCELLVRQQKYDDAKTLLKSALEHNPKSAPYWAALAMVDLTAKNYEQASKTITDAKANIGFSMPVLTVELKLFLLQDKNTAKDKADLLVKELTYLPNDQKVQALKAVAEFYLFIKEYPKAQEVLQTVEKLVPTDNDIVFRRMKIAFVANDTVLFNELLDKVQKAFGDETPESYFGQALSVILQIRAGSAPKTDISKAEQFLLKANEKRPGWSELKPFLKKKAN